MPLQQICVTPMDRNKDVGEKGSKQEQKRKESSTMVSPVLPPLERCSSLTSTLSLNYDICRICHCEGDNEFPLIAPCYCSGSLRYVHQACLQQWIKSSDIKSCELCKFQFIMQSKIKPFAEWEKLEMTPIERRKLLCSVTFHIVAFTSVIWSLYVLIDKTAEEIRAGLLKWPFWTKLIVVAVGFTGGLVFMYIQCKMYIQLCKRWKAFNRVIFVQNAPEKMPLPKDVPSVDSQPPPSIQLVTQAPSLQLPDCAGPEGEEWSQIPLRVSTISHKSTDNADVTNNGSWWDKEAAGQFSSECETSSLLSLQSRTEELARLCKPKSSNQIGIDFGSAEVDLQNGQNGLESTETAPLCGFDYISSSPRASVVQCPSPSHCQSESQPDSCVTGVLFSGVEADKTTTDVVFSNTNMDTTGVLIPSLLNNLGNSGPRPLVPSTVTSGTTKDFREIDPITVGIFYGNSADK